MAAAEAAISIIPLLILSNLSVSITLHKDCEGDCFFRVL